MAAAATTAHLNHFLLLIVSFALAGEAAAQYNDQSQPSYHEESFGWALVILFSILIFLIPLGCIVLRRWCAADDRAVPPELELIPEINDQTPRTAPPTPAELDGIQVETIPAALYADQPRPTAPTELDAIQLENIPALLLFRYLNEQYLLMGETFTDDECSVCLFDFKDEDLVRLLQCNHVFHRDCIDAWFATKGTCPICRSNMVAGNEYEVV